MRDSYILRTDVDALAIFPHAHYLCREITVEAALPDGHVRTRLDDAAKQFEAVLRLRPDDQAASRALDVIRGR